jgi:hypothetical protein
MSGCTNPACPLRVQRQAREQACHRARSGPTQVVSVIESRKSTIHAVVTMAMSGQLRFLGSMQQRVGNHHPGIMQQSHVRLRRRRNKQVVRCYAGY